MMFSVKYYINAAFYVVSYLFCTMLIAYGMPKRKFFLLKVVSILVLLYALYVGLGFAMSALNIKSFGWLGLCRYLVFFCFACAATMFCFDCNFWAALFCATVGYCLEHFSERFFELFNRTFFVDFPFVLLMCIKIVFYAVCIFLIEFLFIRRSKYYKCSIMLDNKMQIIISLILVVLLIFVSGRSISVCQGNKQAITMVNILMVSVSLMGILFEIGMVSNHNNKEELLAIKRILHEERERYQLEKEYINIINIKCHDMRHKFSDEDSEKKSDEDETKEQIRLYDESIDTGNEALNVAIRKKNAQCNQLDICFTSLIDGRKLDFLLPHEIYSLFGNALENAINAVKDLPEEKRIISLTETGCKNFVNIRLENYTSGDIVFADGLPVTKKDIKYHGYGMKSMKYIVEKYGGLLRAYVKGEVFVLEILFPEIVRK